MLSGTAHLKRSLLTHSTTDEPATPSDRIYVDLDSIDEDALSPDSELRPSTVDLDPQAKFEECLRSVTECFPDISHDHVQTMYAESLQSIDLEQAEQLPRMLMERILDNGTYPKEKDRLRAMKELKRKRDDAVSNDGEALRWKNNPHPANDHLYGKIS